MRRRFISIILLMIVSISLLSGCGKNNDNTAAAGKISVVTSFYPIYYIAGEIGGDHAQVVNLIPVGVEPHEWSPKSKDISRVSHAQLFLYNGAGLEGWVTDFLQGLDHGSKLVTKQVSEGVKLINADGEDEAGSGKGVDPHTWVSPKSALVMAENIRSSFIQVDAANKADYEANYDRLKAKLTVLDENFTKDLAAMPNKDIVVSHQAFGYLCRDYGLNQVAIMGLSPDAEPRAQDLLSISKFVKQHGIKTIFFEELVSDELAKTLAREADVSTMVLNPLEGLTPEEEAKGDNYVTIMEVNLQNLKKALQ
jgi:zinc transport system substrate-binding protein